MFSSHDLRLIPIPTADTNFREDVQRAVEHLPQDSSDEELRLALLDELRRWYRAVEVVPQDGLAQFGGYSTPAWYVYRDGRVRRHDDRRERLYAAMASARRTLDVSRAAVADAQAVARAAGWRDGGADTNAEIAAGREASAP